MAEPSNVSAAPSGEGGPFHTAMAHFYRAEIHRMTVWRSRLDTTSNWAILLTTGLTTFTLGSPTVPHYTLLLGLALNSICMLIEGRRYQHLHHSEWRLHLLESGYLAPWLEPGTPAGWKEALAGDLRDPHATICLLDAVRRRLRRNYAMLFYFMTAVWLTKLFIHPGLKVTDSFYRRLAVGDIIPSWFVAASATLFVLVITFLSVATPSRESVERPCPPGARPGARPPPSGLGQA